MSKWEKLMERIYSMEIIEDKEEGGFVISYPDLPGSVTCGETVENYSGQFKLRIPRSLHRLLAEHSQREGISMNQYCVYLLSRNDAIFSK